MNLSILNHKTKGSKAAQNKRQLFVIDSQNQDDPTKLSDKFICRKENNFIELKYLIDIIKRYEIDENLSQRINDQITDISKDNSHVSMPINVSRDFFNSDFSVKFSKFLEIVKKTNSIKEFKLVNRAKTNTVMQNLNRFHFTLPDTLQALYDLRTITKSNSLYDSELKMLINKKIAGILFYHHSLSVPAILHLLPHSKSQISNAIKNFRNGKYEGNNTDGRCLSFRLRKKYL